jgi:hypothetical protein
MVMGGTNINRERSGLSGISILHQIYFMSDQK